MLHVIPGLGAGGGAEQSLLADAEAVLASGIELHIAILSDRRALVPTLESRGVIIHDLSSVAGTARRTHAIRRLIRLLDPDVVHATLFDADLPTQLAVGRSGRPLLVTWAGTSYSTERRSEPGLHWGKLQAVRYTELLLGRWSNARYQAVTPGVATSNGTALHVDRRRIHVAERGRPVPPDPDPTRRAATRLDLGLAENDRLVVCVARHEPPKGVGRVIAAVDHLHRTNPDVTLVVAGREGSLTAALRQQVAATTQPDRFLLLGQRDDVGALLEAADVFVSSSLSEGAAGAVIEAMSWSVPIVATRVTGLAGILEDDNTARLVHDGDDESSFADGIAAVLGDPDLARRLGRSARSMYDDRFTSARSSATLASLYRELATAAAI